MAYLYKLFFGENQQNLHNEDLEEYHIKFVKSFKSNFAQDDMARNRFKYCAI